MKKKINRRDIDLNIAFQDEIRVLNMLLQYVEKVKKEKEYNEIMEIIKAVVDNINRIIWLGKESNK